MKDILQKYIDLIVEWGIAQDEADSKKSKKFMMRQINFIMKLEKI